MSLTDKGADFACGQYTQKVQATVIHPKVDVFFKDFIEKIPNTGIKSCGAKVYFLRKFLQSKEGGSVMGTRVSLTSANSVPFQPKKFRLIWSCR